MQTPAPTRWIKTSITSAVLHGKKIKASTRISQTETLVEVIGKIYSKPGRAGEITVAIQFEIPTGKYCGRLPRFELTQNQFEKVRRVSGECYEFAYDGLLEPESDCDT